MAARNIRIEVVAALPDRQLLLPMTVPAGTTLAEAVARAELPSRLPGLEIDESRLGIFGRKCRPDTVLGEGDRAEVYRPLTADPKVIRRELAELARARQKLDK